MLINVKNLEKGNSEDIVCEGIVKIPESYSEYPEISVKINGDVTKTGEDKFSFKGEVQAKATVRCDLCLEPFEYDFSFEMCETFVKEGEKHEEEEWEYSSRTLNLEPSVIANVLLNYPMRAVCSDECKGLCRICGHNLNDSDCGCDRTYIDPRFEKLRSLFDKEV